MMAFCLLAAVWTLLVAKAWLLRSLALQDASIGQALLLEGPLLLGILLVVDAFFADYRLVAYTAVDLILSLLMAATAVYAGYYNSVPSRETFAGVGQAASVTDSIASLVQPVHAAFFADVLMLALISIVSWLVRRRSAGTDSSQAEESGYVFQYRLVYAALVPALALLAFGVVSVRTMPSPIDPSIAARARGVLTYQTATLLPVTSTPVASIDLKDPAVVQARIDQLMGSPGDERVEGFSAGEASGANVIVIQVEALQMAAFEGKVAGREIMPNLRRYAERSWYFPRGIAQVGRGTTSDAELMSNASVYPATSGPSSVVYGSREIPSLPRVLGKHGYESLTFHTNSVEFWNRHQLYTALGFTRYYDREFFGTEDAIAFGASDEVLFGKTFTELESKAKAGTPFYAQIVTMSSHHPFIGVPRERVPLQLDETFADTMTGRYVEEQSYADAVLGRFPSDSRRAVWPRRPWS
jgi:phosphoglycerol transferase MdoB-like AlkP superfamily enzyme